MRARLAATHGVALHNTKSSQYKGLAKNIQGFRSDAGRSGSRYSLVFGI
jgi:hypothetical protein